MHDFKSFIKHGLKEWTTYVGVGILIFSWLYHNEINILIKNVLTSNELAAKIINGLSILVGFIFIMFKEKEEDKSNGNDNK